MDRILHRHKRWWRIGAFSQTLTVDPLIAALGVSTTGTYEVSGALLGATLGYNRQAGSWVLGIEGDIDWSSIGGQVTGPVMGVPATFETQLPWLNTFRARVGYAFGSFFPYLTGGGASGGVRATDAITIPGSGNVLGGLSDVRLGGPSAQDWNTLSARIGAPRSNTFTST